MLVVLYTKVNINIWVVWTRNMYLCSVRATCFVCGVDFWLDGNVLFNLLTDNHSLLFQYDGIILPGK